MICRKRITVIFLIFSALLLAGCSAYSVDSDDTYATPGVSESAGCWLSTDNLAVHDYSTGIDAYPQRTCMELCIREDSTFDMVLAIVGNMKDDANILKQISGTIETEPVDMFGSGAYRWSFHWTDGGEYNGEFESVVRLNDGKLSGVVPSLNAYAYGEEDRKYSRTKDESACSRFVSNTEGL